jgi:hypothetical protein
MDFEDLYEHPNDGDKSNDSSSADVIWANTQSPANKVLTKMLREAHSKFSKTFS